MMNCYHPDDALHVILDALADFRHRLEGGEVAPWADYGGESGTDPKVTEDGYLAVIERARELVQVMLSRSTPLPGDQKLDLPTATCVHCERVIVLDPQDGWVDPDASGDDVIWRETCDQHDTFTAEHEPEEPS